MEIKAKKLMKVKTNITKIKTIIQTSNIINITK